jgi:glycosyltransferase involved in cell wall biosynthesis
MTASPPTGEPLRVLWITAHTGTPDSVRPDIGLARGLAAAGVELRVVAPEGSHCAAAVERAGLRLVGALPRRSLRRRPAAWLREGCVRERIKLVHCFDRVAVVTALPVLRDLPLAMVMRHDRVGGVQRWNPFARLTQLHPRIDRVICTSDAARDELARRRDPASVVTIRPGHRLDWHRGPAIDLGQFGVPPDAFPVAVVANYRPRKGIEYVVDAAQWLPAGAPVHFLLVGADVANRSVLERISRNPFRANFHVLGHREDAARITAACAVSVRGALRREGMPLTVIESMACGVPPIITDVGGARELVEQGVSGIIVRRRSPRAIGEALAWLYEHPTERRTMGEAARERIQTRFTLERAVEAHLALYRDLHARRSIMPTPAGSRGEGDVMQEPDR